MRHRLTCQVEVLQRSLRSHQGVELRAESAQAVIRPVNLTFGGCDVVRVCDGGASVDVLNLHGHTDGHTHRNIQIFSTARQALQKGKKCKKEKEKKKEKW